MMKIAVLLFALFGCSHSDKLAVYWGQDSAGGLHYDLEKEIGYFCSSYEYDIIPIAFVDFFFYPFNKDSLPSINLANHCNKTFKDYPGLLDCPKVASAITTCQDKGKKILISLGGSAGLYGFTSSSQAIQFANTIWNLFLGGTSSVRPFGGIILDGIDFDIEAETTRFYADFIKTIRQLMTSDENKKYLITGAPQCPYPDFIMGPGAAGTVLQDIPQEFDYLFVQFYNNYCYLGSGKSFNESLTSWFQFAENTRTTYGKGPLIFLGIPAHPRASSGAQYYHTPDFVRSIYEPLKGNPNLGGIMLWDASFDMNNVINGRHYSSYISDFLLTNDGDFEPEIAICYGPQRFFNGPLIKPWIIAIIAVSTFIAAIGIILFRRRKLNFDHEKKQIKLEEVADEIIYQEYYEKKTLI